MNDATVIEMISEAIFVAAKLAGPILAVSLAIGVLVSLFQTVTQIQEATLTFVPKIAGAAAIIVIAGTWMLQELTEWVTRLWTSIPDLV